MNAALFRHPLTASRFTNLKDAFFNRIDGFKPYTLMVRTPKSHAPLFPIIDVEGLKGKAGRKFINWVKTERKGKILKRSTLNWTGSTTASYYDVYTQKPLFKAFDNNKVCIKTVYNNKGQAQYIEKRNKGKDAFSSTSLYEKDTDGKFKLIFKGFWADMPKKLADRGKNPNPFEKTIDDIWYSSKN